MKVFFASGDVGGARAILPVIAACEKNGIPFALLEHGHISKEAPTHWEKISLNSKSNQYTFKRILGEHDIKVLVFTSSLKDPVALTLARVAKDCGVITIHILDHWSNYRERMETDDLPTFLPHYYAVMDSLAFNAAVKSGIDESTLIVTGQPALSALSDEYHKWEKGYDHEELKRIGFNPEKRMISYISEPVESDQGATLSSPKYRGYTEKDILRLLCKSLQSFSDKVQIAIFPHPRENVDDLRSAWNEFRGGLEGRLLRSGEKKTVFFPSDGVAGMASILMYEAWLLGKPVISFQPGVQDESLRMLQKREGVFFIESYEDVDRFIAAWIEKVFDKKKIKIRQELNMHQKTPELVCELIKKHFDGAHQKNDTSLKEQA